MTTLQRVQLLLVVCSLIVHAHGLPLSSFFSYGPTAGDSVLTPTNGASSLALPLQFQLYGTNYSTVYVSFFFFFLIYSSISKMQGQLYMQNNVHARSSNDVVLFSQSVVCQLVLSLHSEVHFHHGCIQVS